MNPLIHFWLKSGKFRELESQKVRESHGTLVKKLGGNPVCIIVANIKDTVKRFILVKKNIFLYVFLAFNHLYHIETSQLIDICIDWFL